MFLLGVYVLRAQLSQGFMNDMQQHYTYAWFWFSDSTLSSSSSSGLPCSRTQPYTFSTMTSITQRDPWTRERNTWSPTGVVVDLETWEGGDTVMAWTSQDSLEGLVGASSALFVLGYNVECLRQLSALPDDLRATH